MPPAQVAGQADDLLGRLGVRLQREEDPMFRRSGSLPIENSSAPDATEAPTPFRASLPAGLAALPPGFSM
jgi:hypothetical protein